MNKSKFLKSATLAIAGVALASSLSSCKMFNKHKEEAAAPVAKEEKAKCSSKTNGKKAKKAAAVKSEKAACSAKAKEDKAKCSSKKAE